MKMDARRAMLWLMLAGSVMFTTYTLWPSKKGLPTRPATATNAPPAPAAAPPGAAPPPTPATAMPENEWVAWRAQLNGTDRDPFHTAKEIAEMNRPPAVARVEAPPPAVAPEYVVKLVVMTGSKGKAMVGDRVVQVGDMLGDERVTEIHRDGVVLERDGVRRRLQLATGGTNLAAIRLERNR